MNVKYLQFSLLVVLLAAGFVSTTARAGCDQEELCEVELVVTGLLTEIVGQREVIKTHWKSLESAQHRDTVSGWYARTLRLVDVVSRYLHIGTLESQLLVANNKVSSVRSKLSSHERICHCNEKIQLSARY